MKERSIRKTRTLILGLSLALFASFASAATTIEAYGNVPLSFEPNRGQTKHQVKFLSRGSGYTLFLTSNEAVLTLRKSDTASTVLRMRLVGANRKASVTGVDPLPGRSNYLIGNDPSKWRHDVPNYSKVRYQDLYRGIDLIYYGQQQQLEYDFVVAAGADPNKIQLSFTGTDSLAIDESGDLIVDAMRLYKPVAYQERDGQRTPVAARYILAGNHRVRFEVAAYDASRPLVIDPVLVYSTYLGGSGDELAFGIAVDAFGNAYVTGRTTSADFPTTSGAFDNTFNGGFNDVFVTKLNATGSALVYSTYLGGSRCCGDGGQAIAVDIFGNAYVTGYTYSADFPTTPGAFDTVFDGVLDAFVTKLNASGSALIYSTFLGSNSIGRGIALDSSGSAYVTGEATADFPTTPGAYDTTFDGGDDVFVTKLNPDGSALVYSTFIGGNNDTDGDDAYGIAVDTFGNAYVTGRTVSTDFPTTPGAFDVTFNGVQDVFVTKLNSSGSALVYSTYLGGSGNDVGAAIAVDSAGNAYVTGYTDSADYPTTAGAFDTTFNGGVLNGFVTKFAAAGSIIYSTFLDGVGNGIAADSAGNACVAGGAITKLNSTGSTALFSTNLVGGIGIALDASGDVYVTGTTSSTDFPTTPGAFDTTFNGGDQPGFNSDGFVAKLVPVLPPEEQLKNLENLITGFKLPGDVANSFLAKVKAAQQSLARGNRTSASNQLNALINEARAQVGKKLTREQARAIIEAAQGILNTLG